MHSDYIFFKSLTISIWFLNDLNVLWCLRFRSIKHTFSIWNNVKSRKIKKMVVCCKNNAHFSKEAKGVKSVAVRIWHKRMRLHMTHAELWQYLSCSKTIVLLYWDSCVTWYINLMSHMECTRSYISIYTQLPINIFLLEC